MEFYCEQLMKDFWYVGVSDSQLRAYHHASFTENGIMYSTYLLKTEDGSAIVFGAMPRRFLQEWIEKLTAVVPAEKLAWVVLFGTEDDLAAANALLALNPQITLVAGAKTLFQLKGRTDSRFASIEIRGSRRLVLGGRHLEICANAMTYAYDEISSAVFTGGSFGALGAFDVVRTSEIERAPYLQSVHLCDADLPGRRYRKLLRDTADRIRKWGVSLICPALGPVADKDLEVLLSIYEGTANDNRGLTLAVVYDSGVFVQALAEKICEGVQDSGAITIRTCALSSGKGDAIDVISAADAVLFGVSETFSEPSKAIWDIITSLYPEDVAGKPASVFCFAGSAGRSAKILRERLAQLAADTNDAGYEINKKPGDREEQNAYEFGYNFGCIMQKIPNPRKPKLMYCPICGEIFDAALGSCPVCGVGLDQCIPASEEDSVYKITSSAKYVILGGGIAAVSAAEAIRRRDDGGSITILSAEPHLPINRPQLTKNLFAVQTEGRTLPVHDQEWYDERNIMLRLGVRAVSIDPAEKQVRTDDGGSVPYDKLIYALGAECFVPPIPGAEREGVVTIRHVSDGKELLRLCKTAKAAVVIGGGVIGLETAYELCRLGLKVTVLEAAPQLLGRQIDKKSAEILTEKMNAMGVKCLAGVTIAGIEGETRCTGVTLSDGQTFPAELVVVSCGTVAQTALASSAGIQCGRAVIVGQRMETNLPDIYACGDCAQYDGVNYQLWAEASVQGSIAGANAAGEQVLFSNKPLGMSINAFQTSIFAIGDPGKGDGLACKTVELTDNVAGKHETYWFRGRALEGAVLIGAADKAECVRRAAVARCRYEHLAF